MLTLFKFPKMQKFSRLTRVWSSFLGPFGILLNIFGVLVTSLK